MRASLALLFCLLPLFVEAQPTSQPSTSLLLPPLPAPIEDSAFVLKPSAPLYTSSGVLLGGWAAGWSATFFLTRSEDLATEGDFPNLEYVLLLGTARLLMSTAILTTGVARYRQTHKLRSLYAATGLAALRFGVRYQILAQYPPESLTQTFGKARVGIWGGSAAIEYMTAGALVGGLVVVSVVELVKRQLSR